MDDDFIKSRHPAHRHIYKNHKNNNGSGQSIIGLAILGGILGLVFGGPPGAVIGGVIGFIVGLWACLS